MNLSAGNLFIDICFLWGGVDITGIIFVFSCEITMTNQLRGLQSCLEFKLQARDVAKQRGATGQDQEKAVASCFHNDCLMNHGMVAAKSQRVHNAS